MLINKWRLKHTLHTCRLYFWWRTKITKVLSTTYWSQRSSTKRYLNTRTPWKRSSTRSVSASLTRWSDSAHSAFEEVELLTQRQVINWSTVCFRVFPGNRNLRNKLHEWNPRRRESKLRISKRLTTITRSSLWRPRSWSKCLNALNHWCKTYRTMLQAQSLSQDIKLVSITNH